MRKYSILYLVLFTLTSVGCATTENLFSDKVVNHSLSPGRLSVDQLSVYAVDTQVLMKKGPHLLPKELLKYTDKIVECIYCTEEVVVINDEAYTIKNVNGIIVITFKSLIKPFDEINDPIQELMNRIVDVYIRGVMFRKKGGGHQNVEFAIPNIQGCSDEEFSYICETLGLHERSKITISEQEFFNFLARILKERGSGGVLSREQVGVLYDEIADEVEQIATSSPARYGLLKYYQERYWLGLSKKFVFLEEE